jgi:hypothetical protein
LQRRELVADKIDWIKDMDLALENAGDRSLPVLLFFHNSE